MSDRAGEVARELVPERATKIMVDTASGDRSRYSADEWREHIAAALRAHAEEARREEREACAVLVAPWGCNMASATVDGEHIHHSHRQIDDFCAHNIAAAIRAREEGTR